MPFTGLWQLLCQLFRKLIRQIPEYLQRDHTTVKFLNFSRFSQIWWFSCPRPQLDPDQQHSPMADDRKIRVILCHPIVAAIPGFRGLYGQ